MIEKVGLVVKFSWCREFVIIEQAKLSNVEHVKHMKLKAYLEWINSYHIEM